MSIIQWIRKTPFLSSLYKQSILPRAKIKCDRIIDYLPSKSHILDIGAGNAGLAYSLKLHEHDIHAIDIINHSFYEDLPIKLYDGKEIPYKDDTFDYSLLITVLHHIEDPIAVLKEAVRVSEKVIVMEDIYHSTWNKYLLFFVDSLVNFEFIGHPHTNKSDSEWESVFQSLGVFVEKKRTDKIIGIFEQVTYVLSKDQSKSKIVN